jgi:hypothetical protein
MAALGTVIQQARKSDVFTAFQAEKVRLVHDGVELAPE